MVLATAPPDIPLEVGLDTSRWTKQIKYKDKLKDADFNKLRVYLEKKVYLEKNKSAQ